MLQTWLCCRLLIEYKAAVITNAKLRFFFAIVKTLSNRLNDTIMHLAKAITFMSRTPGGSCGFPFGRGDAKIEG